MLQEVMDIEEVAKFLKVSERTVLREIKAGKIKAFRVGRSLRFKREEVEKYMQSQEVHPDSIATEDAEDAA